MSKRILITGISGFAGNYLVRNLLSKKNAEIFGTYLTDNSLETLSDVRKDLKLYKLDLMDPEAVLKTIKDAKPDQVYHLAAIAASSQSFNEPGLIITNNINSQLNLLEALKVENINARILIVSSAEVYGKVDPKDLPIDENTPLNPANPYAVSKIAQDFLGLQYHITYNIDVVRVRPFNHIGPGQTDQFATSAFAKKIAEIEKGKKEPVLTVGNLESKRDFTDVKDMMEAYVLIMDKAKSGEVYNIGSGKSYKMSDILNILLSFSNTKIKIEIDPKLLRPSDNPDLVSDNTKVETLTGWKPKIPINQTLKDILEYWRNLA